jgi:SAM-dependent methyltransferase
MQMDDLQAGSATPQLVDRERCPGCAARSSHCLLSVPYADESMQSFLRRHYHRPPDTSPLDGWPYELVRCDVCGLAYQRYIPGPALLQDIYDRWISPNGFEQERDERTLEDSCLMAQEVHFLISSFRLRPGEIKVLDFGMGWSKWLKMARAHGCQVSGAELSVARQRYARSIGIEVLDWDEIATRRFQFINAEQVFEHLVEPREVLAHLAGALAENGVLRISVPNARSALRVVERKRSFDALTPKHIMPIQPLEHLNSFEPATLERFGRLAGLEPFRPSLRLLYNGSSGWLSPKSALKALLRPVYRHVWPKSTIAYFRKRTVTR